MLALIIRRESSRSRPPASSSSNHDGEDLADISLIEVADGVTGTVEVHVMRDPADEVGTTGARDVNEIDLTNDQGASLVGVLGVIDIGGDLGTLGGVTVNDVTGSLGYIWFADDVQGEITIPDDPGVRPRFSGLRSMILGDLLTPDFSDSRSAGPSGSAAKTRESRARSGILGSACLG
jgi:hypothetical protein